MGQKVNPNGLRLGINKDWDSKWYADKKDFKKFTLKPVADRLADIYATTPAAVASQTTANAHTLFPTTAS